MNPYLTPFYGVGTIPGTFPDIFLYKSSSNPVTQVQMRKQKLRESSDLPKVTQTVIGM